MYNNKWTFSLSEDNFSYGEYFDTKLEAYEAGKEYAIESGESHIYIGQCKEYVPQIYAEDIIERVSETAYDEMGEWAEDFLCDVGKDAEQELQGEIEKVFFAWLNKHNLNSNFHEVINIQKINLEVK